MLHAILVLALPFCLEAQSELPDAPGKETLKKVCTNCHDVESVTGVRQTRIGWQRTVDDMISRGADGTEDEMSAVVTYLTTWFGKTNVNTASAADLRKALELSEKEAQAITTYRDRNGRIKDFEELQKVPGVDPEKLRAKRSLIAFTQ